VALEQCRKTEQYCTWVYVHGKYLQPRGSNKRADKAEGTWQRDAFLLLPQGPRVSLGMCVLLGYSVSQAPNPLFFFPGLPSAVSSCSPR